MQRWFTGSLAAFSIFASGAAALQPGDGAPVLVNMDFEQGEVGAPPPAWTGKLALTSDMRPKAGSKSLSLNNDTAEFVTFSRVVPAAAYRGKYLRFRAAVRTTAASGAGLWLRIDGPPNKMLFLDNMSERRVTAADWTWAEINVDVPLEAEYIAFGGLVYGPGSAGFDAASLQALPPETDPTKPEVLDYLDRALSHLEAGHLNRHRIDWPATRARAARLAAHAQTPAQTYPAIRMAITELGERHTLLIAPATDMNRIATGASPPPISAAKIGDGIVKLTLPGSGDPLGDVYRDSLRSKIAEQQASGACGWIVDLRENTGGNAFPMLDGLAPLLGPLPWGGFQDADGQMLVWSMSDDRVIQIPVRDFPRLTAPLSPLLPVAVLIGPRTASSGEVTAIALAGRENSRSFGAATAGFTTGNVPIRLSDGATLVLTSTRDLDRRGRVVEGPLRPDVPTPSGQVEDAAVAWLASKGCQ